MKRTKFTIFKFDLNIKKYHENVFFEVFVIQKENLFIQRKIFTKHLKMR